MSASTFRIDRTVTSGTFSLDGGTWDVDNNVWVIGDDTECVVIDAPHDATAIIDLVGGRTVTAILLTHAHDDHIDAVSTLFEAVEAPVHLHPDDRMLWDAVHADTGPDGDLADGAEFSVAGRTLRVLHTPGHSPGSCCFHLPEEGVVFTGDTLFSGGPGATGRSYSSFETIIASITEKLLTLLPETVVHTGHGDSTTIGAEAPHRQEWVDRGH
ncbi:MBL fold metallo-hydrolase [Auraticoccus monumenti]|uniref:Glyoxylase, beta-lactamase superfamily II n=1 Tax=Auraticoccus monumenti TaxID=675864 RepID=A0A1G7ENZ1_9ACTN|nr:MBL fold metallo-hydrolase [Auraticoccus monumenti]SDE65095.1 Glyoxylase, beta-lactamase superfamily II [Auraticoccus monumenti]